MRFEKFIEDNIRVLLDEINQIKKDDSNDYVLTYGEYVANEGNNYIYKFTTEYEISLSDSFPVTISVKGDLYEAVIISIEQNTIILSFKRQIDKSIEKVFLSCDPSFLLDALKERLKECLEERIGLSHYLINNGQRVDNNNSIPGKSQLQQMILNNKVTFIWGPPGSGKTTSLGKIASEFVLKGKRILIVSQSNTSVDEAILSIKNNFSEDSIFLNDCKIIRYGYIKKDILRNDAQCNPYKHVEDNNSERQIRLNKLKYIIKQFSDGKIVDNITDIKNEKNTLEKEIDNEVKSIIRNATVIATTVSKATIDSYLCKGNFDIVIFDEASMAYVPQIAYAASLAKEKFLCFGDLKQLAPISKVHELQQDIYDYLGMINHDGTIYHQWLVMLDEQYRSQPEIANFANKTFYSGKIKNNDIVYGERINKILSSEPFSNKALVLLDTSGFYASSCRTLENSRINIVDACIAVITATNICRNNRDFSVGIITPYAAQARLIRKLLTDDIGGRKFNIECSTVHQFQGSERDVIIFDTIENYPYDKLGLITRNTTNRAVDRLVNVAVTRTRGKIIVIGNYSYWNNYAKNNNPLLKLMRYIGKIDESNIISDSELKRFIERKRIGRIKLWDDDDNAAYQFIEDIRFAKKKISIMLSNGDNINKICLKELIELMKENKNLDLEIKVPNSSDELNRLKNYVYIIKRDSLPLAIIDDEIVWYGVPDMNRFYNMSDGHIREYNKSMIRIVGKQVSNTLDDLLDFRNDLEIINKKQNGEKLIKYVATKTCSQCGGGLFLINEKHLFTKCKKCGVKEYLDYRIVNDFIKENNIVCPNDGGKLTARIGTYGMLLKCSERHNITIKDFFDL